MTSLSIRRGLLAVRARVRVFNLDLHFNLALLDGLAMTIFIYVSEIGLSNRNDLQNVPRFLTDRVFINYSLRSKMKSYYYSGCKFC